MVNLDSIYATKIINKSDAKMIVDAIENHPLYRKNESLAKLDLENEEIGSYFICPYYDGTRQIKVKIIFKTETLASALRTTSCLLSFDPKKDIDEEIQKRNRRRNFGLFSSPNNLQKALSGKEEKKLSTKRKAHKIKEAEPKKKKRKITLPVSLAESGWESLEASQNFTYLESKYDLDRTDLVFVEAVRILHRVNGHGAFAAEDIPAGTIIGEYTGSDESNSEDDSYRMRLGGNKFVDALKKGNFTRFINHSESQANVVFEPRIKENKKIVVVRALEKIIQYRKLLVNYNIYDEAKFKNFYFLNTDDSWLSPQDHVNGFSSFYQLKKSERNLSIFGLVKDDKYYFPKHIIDILDHQLLTDDSLRERADGINLRIIKANEKDEAMDFDPFDSTTALMVASYLGQAHNVDLLLENGAKPNIQQTLSGKTALFFAVMGYRNRPQLSESYLKIIKNLIDHHADTFIQDRKSEIFLFYAIKFLKPKDFKDIIDFIKKSRMSVCNAFKFINDDNDDLFMFGIKHKKFGNLKTILSYYPNYIEQNFIKKQYFDIEELKGATKDYTDQDFVELKKIFGTHADFLKPLLEEREVMTKRNI